MSNVSIYEKNWTELVFEDRNKAYGAYQLRQENPRTTLVAFFSGILITSALIGSWALFSSFSDGTEIEIDEFPIVDAITPVDLSSSPRKKQPEQQQQAQTPQEPTSQDPINMAHLVPAETNQAVATIPTNENMPTNNNNTGTAIGTDTTGENRGTTATTTGTNTGTEGVISSAVLDKLPEYPGGIRKFYEYVGNSIEKSEIENSANEVRVIMSFVVEKDGTMTDIKVLRSSDKALEKEAIRVLKALKVKWAPGYLNGEKVRTQYTLPIKVAI
ncbi:energy transducer TonB [Flavobacterium sp.]